MKRKTLTIVVLVLLLAMVISVSPAGAATRRIGLISATAERGKGGAEFSFRVWGKFDGFSGFVRHQGKVYDLQCNLKATDNKILFCRMYGPPMADQMVQVVVNGFSFDTYVKAVDVCYSVYDWPNPPAGDFGPWVDYGDHCQKEVPDEGSLHTITTSAWGTWEYIFLRKAGFCGPGGSWNDYGVGFYYTSCF